jgi:hypothetical protein
MSRRRPISLGVPVLLMLCLAAPAFTAPPNHEKTIWNYDGGLQMMTDGEIPGGPCFRINGRATAPGFFDNLRRVDTLTGTLFHRGNDIITEFPAVLHLSFLLYDFPCDDRLQNAVSPLPTYLTNTIVSTLRLSFYWKHGMVLRPAKGVTPVHYETRRLAPYATELASELPERYEWEFEFSVPSAGVPVTDSLVIVLLTPNGHIAARAAARM